MRVRKCNKITARLHADTEPSPPSPRSYIIPFAKQHAPKLMYEAGVMPSRGSAAVTAARGVKRATKSIYPLSEKRRGRETKEGGETIK